MVAGLWAALNPDLTSASWLKCRGRVAEEEPEYWAQLPRVDLGPSSQELTSPAWQVLVAGEARQGWAEVLL
jgi:hypothetical protein